MRSPTSISGTLIKGNYWVEPDGSDLQPDGDTISFEPDSIGLVMNLPQLAGKSPSIKNNRIDVRYEGIDALESHYYKKHQNIKFANEATRKNLELLGFSGVTFKSDSPTDIKSISPNKLPGYVIALGIEKYGRMLGFIYSGATNLRDGEIVHSDEPFLILSQSINIELVTAGLVYAAPYDSMPDRLVSRLRDIITTARNGKLGIWLKEDITTEKACIIKDINGLQELIMWPKLFRRLSKYFKGNNSGLIGFDGWLRSNTDEDIPLLLPDGKSGYLHDAYQINGDTLRLKFKPEDLILVEKLN
jgi:endonuclease YncB( thermonuclease family)